MGRGGVLRSNVKYLFPDLFILYVHVREVKKWRVNSADTLE